MEKEYIITVRTKYQVKASIDADEKPQKEISTIERIITKIINILKNQKSDTYLAMLTLGFYLIGLIIGLVKNVDQIVKISILISFFSSVSSLILSKLKIKENKELINWLVIFAISAIITAALYKVINWEIAERRLTIVSFVLILSSDIIKNFSQNM